MEKFNLTKNSDISYLKENINIDIVNKDWENKDLILSSSAITLIKSLLDLIFYILFIDNLTYEIFVQIFNLFDYFILASINLFSDKLNINKLFEEINLTEMKKKGKLQQTFELILFQKKFSNLKRFFITSKSSMEKLFNVEIDILKNNYNENENFEISEFHLPKLNSQVNINDNNVYSCMVETIILYESIFSVLKILNGLKHFTKVNSK